MQISREKYLDKNSINPKLFNKLINLYGVIFNDYRKCYKELKAEIEEKPIEGKRFSEILATPKMEEKFNKIEKNNILEIQSLKKLPQDDINELNNHCKIDKNVILANKMKSSNIIVRIKGNFDKPKDEQKINKDKEFDKNNEINHHVNSEEENIIKYFNNKNEKKNRK